MSNVWTVEAAVNELMQLRSSMHSLQEREQTIRALVERWKRDAQAMSPHHPGRAIYLRCASMLEVQLIPDPFFAREREP